MRPLTPVGRILEAVLTPMLGLVRRSEPRTIKPPAIIVSNHPTQIDPVIIHAFLRYRLNIRPIFFAKASLLKHPLKRLMIRSFNAIVIDEQHPSSALKLARHALEGGHVVVIFPEGRLSRFAASVKTGAVRFSKASGVPVHPITITPAPSIFPIRRSTIIIHEPRTYTNEQEVRSASHDLIDEIRSSL